MTLQTDTQFLDPEVLQVLLVGVFFVLSHSNVLSPFHIDILTLSLTSSSLDESL